MGQEWRHSASGASDPWFVAQTRENEMDADEFHAERVAANGAVESALQHRLRAGTYIPVAERQKAAHVSRGLASALTILQGAVA